MGTEIDPRGDDSTSNDLKTLILDSESLLDSFNMVQTQFGHRISKISLFIAKMSDLSQLNKSGCKWVKKECESRSLEIQTSVNQERSEEYVAKLLKHSSMLGEIEERAVSVLRKRMVWLKEFTSKIESQCEVFDKFYEEISEQVTNDLGSEEMQISVLYKEFYVEKEKYTEALNPARCSAEPSSSTKIPLNTIINTAPAAIRVLNDVPMRAEDRSILSLVGNSVSYVIHAVMSSSSSSSSSNRPNDTGSTERSTVSSLKDSSASGINHNPTGRTSAIMKNLDQAECTDSDRDVELDDNNGSAKKHGNAATTVIGDKTVKSQGKFITLDLDSEDEDKMQKKEVRSNPAQFDAMQSLSVTGDFNDRLASMRATDSAVIIGSAEVQRSQCKDEIMGDSIEYPTKNTNSSTSSSNNNSSTTQSHSSHNSNAVEGIVCNDDDVYNNNYSSSSSSASSSRSSSCRTVDESVVIDNDSIHIAPPSLPKYAQSIGSLPLQYGTKVLLNAVHKGGNESDDEDIVVIVDKNEESNSRSGSWINQSNQGDLIEGGDRGAGGRGGVRGSVDGVDDHRCNVQPIIPDAVFFDDHDFYNNNGYNNPRHNHGNGSSSSTCSLQNSSSSSNYYVFRDNIDIGSIATGVKRRTHGSKRKLNSLDNGNDIKGEYAKENKKRGRKSMKDEMDDFIVNDDEDEEDEFSEEEEERKVKKPRKSSDNGGKKKAGGKGSNTVINTTVRLSEGTVDLT